jgi:poly(3-hydroxybutyrate) depolymerase
MIYRLYDMQRAAWAPLGLAAVAARGMSGILAAAFGDHHAHRAMNAACEFLERGIRHPRNAAFDVKGVLIDGIAIPVEERVADRRPFCTLRHFARAAQRDDPKVLVVAPLSGHCSALLNDAVETLLEFHDVYLTDWSDAREVPVDDGPFGLHTYIADLIDYFRMLGPDLHVVAFSQSTVPTLAAAALLADAGGKAGPRSLTLVAGPLDARINATQAQAFAARHPRAWYEATMISTVPYGYAGAGRRVLPGFVQLAGYVTHDFERHLGAHWDFFGRLLAGDDAAAAAHRRFYDRFFSALDLTAEFFLDTLSDVFQNHALARGAMRWRGVPVVTRALADPALLTIEGGADDVSTPGQTAVAHSLCPNIPPSRRAHHLEPEAGHLGLFYGHHWRRSIEPRIRNFIGANR